MTAFAELGMMPEIVQAIEEMEWLLPTDVQAEAIPLILGGGDVLMAAETGSGKTGAFCLPVIQIVHESLKEKSGGGQQVGGGDASKKVVMNPYDRGDKLAISSEGLLIQCREQRAWNGCRSSSGVGGGKVYYEAIVTDEGLCRVGWSMGHASLELGKDKNGFGFGGTGKKSYASQFDDYGEAYGKGDTIGCYLDLDSGVVGFSKNGVYLEDAFQVPKQLMGQTFYAAVVLKNAEMQFNFGDQPFKYPPEASYGYTPLSKSTQLVQAMAMSARPSKPGSPRALIIEPARELAQQTGDNIHLFSKHLSAPRIRDLLVMGGDSAKDQIKALQAGVEIVTGTPGRLDDLITTGKLDLSAIRFFILDEADGLLSQGHGDLINKIFSKIPKVSPEGKRLQMVVCSATLHNIEVKKMADRLLHFPTWVDLKGQDSVPETVHQVLCWVDPVKDASWRSLEGTRVNTDGIHSKDNKRSSNPESLSAGVKLLKAEYLVKAINEHKMDQAIIFCRTKLDCDNIEAYLLSLGGGPKAMVNEYTCVCLHSDRRPQERKENLQSFKDGEVRFLICTDVAARGIDIRGIPFVVNVTLPDDKQNYVHRIGRVGRAERMGLAVSLVATVKEKVWYHKCANKGRGCYNTSLLEDGGCAIWYNEPQFIADIQEHLGVSIPVVEDSFQVPVSEYDGKVMYGEKKSTKSGSKGHVAELATSVQELAKMEKHSQSIFLKMATDKKWFL
ncbi:ATP-dependent RNA helicase DDX1-like isoform X2 [Halichondria panicea]|uniref:ATP-dependent RNA helicase DDX1-like isoform X2 n=1 Tax=Halichondria panicea TaxID=6063 RepID=UPI00312B2BD9